MKDLSDHLKNNDIDDKLDSLRCRQILQNAITVGNNHALNSALSKHSSFFVNMSSMSYLCVGMEAMWHVNKALKGHSHSLTLHALQNTALKLENFIPDAAPLYHQEMKADLSDLDVCIFL